MGFIEPMKIFLKFDNCTENKSILIFDEVMTGFVARGRAQELFNIDPDLTALGKIVKVNCW